MINYELLQNCFSLLKEKQFKLITAESLTAGMIASEFAKTPGASTVLWGGITAYNTEAKQKILFVSKNKIKKHGAVSPQIAKAMAKGALKIFATNSNKKNIINFNPSRSAISVAVTGVAGPGKQENKPVGTVYIAVAKTEAKNTVNHGFKNKTMITVKKYFLKGNRQEIREQTVNKAMELISHFAKDHPH